MERIRYQKTLDVHKNGIQFLLQGFETADNLSRVIEISLMASGDAIDFPLEKVEAMMFVTTPNAKEPSINKCTIKDNKVVYEVLPIVEEGITNMQLKIIETSTDGSTGILASPKFAVEVTKSDADDSAAMQTTTFTALEEAMAKAKSVYDERFLRMELTSDCIFKAYYADGTVYETDLLKRLFHEGNSLLSESFAKGRTGIRAGEDTDNAKYYSNVSKSEALNAKNIMENSEKILEEVKLHGVYTAFGIDFETGEVEYVSPSFTFKVNLETGELDAEGQEYTFEDEVGRIVEKWLLANGIVLSELQKISTSHTNEISSLKATAETHAEKISAAEEDIKDLGKRVTPIECGGTGAKTADSALRNLGIMVPPDELTRTIKAHRWETVYSTVVNIDISEGDDYIYNTYQLGDFDTISLYSELRYVLKKGSSFNCYGGTSNSSNITYICVGAGTNRDAIAEFFRIEAHANENQIVTLSEDYILPPFRASNCLAKEYSLSTMFEHTGDYEKGSVGFFVEAEYDDTGDYVKALFTVEIQGRRL